MMTAVEMQTLLRALEVFELSMAKYYGWLAEAHETDREAFLVFHRLHLEENAHASLIRYLRRLVRQNPSLFGPVEADLAEVQAINSRVDGLLAKTWVPSPEEAVTIAAEIEASAAEYHSRTAIAEANPSVARLLEKLGAEDKCHARALWEFGQARGCLPAEATLPSSDQPWIEATSAGQH